MTTRVTKQSKRVGRGWLRNGATYEVYEALVPIECASCDEEIQPGEKFTRLTMIGGGRARHPHCSRCEPISEHNPHQQAHAPSSDRWNWRTI